MALEKKWTRPQQDAIEARGGSLLVSAAAGSGKTAVLTERVLGIICDEDRPVDVDRLLIVTFSAAAAAEMRRRIGERLSSMLQRQPTNSHLRRQQALLQRAQISTIHAFCLSLIRENFQHLAISPDFSIADQNEIELMKAECAAACIEEFYIKDEDGGFSELVELLSSGRDDTRLFEIVYKIYDFSRSHPFYEDWLDEKLAMYAGELPVSETVWGRTVLAHGRESLTHCHGVARWATEALNEAGGKLRDAYLPAFESDLWQLENCAGLARAGVWDGLVAALNGFAFQSLKAVRGDDPLKDALKDSRGRIKNTVKELAEKYLCAGEAEVREDLDDLAPKIRLLFSLVIAFGVAMDEAKSAKKRLDFSDLEHLALRLLVEKRDGHYALTEQAAETASRYDHVMVDEYQDTNEVQDTIFSSVSRDQQNLFMVGDVKQSIYSFRQAMPEIFLLKKKRFFRYDGQSYPAAISLDTNFRSRNQVTSAVNFIFGRIMSARMGEIDYDEAESLKCGASYPETEDMEPELMLLDLSGSDSGTDVSRVEAEAVAEKIHAMIEAGHTVMDGEVPRRAIPRDFCVLLRSPKNRARLYIKALEAQGIGAWAENGGGFLEAREISMVLSFLKALDNPLLDIELVAALLSPIFGFTDDEIAEIRLKNRKAPFFSALGTAAAEGNRKCAEFLALFERLRREAVRLSADRLLLLLCEETGLLGIVRVMPMGEARAANILALIEYAAQYHSMGYKRLSGFVGFLSRMEERGGDLLPATAPGDGANVVRIMSIHRSKGLEFPIVILADTAKQFNLEDLRANTILHSKYGFACVRRDRRVMKQYPTVPMQAIRLEARRSLLSEEMRILYVALTRAREKLILTAALRRNPAKRLKALDGDLVEGRLSPYLAGEASCYGDWILMSLLHHPAGEVLRELGNCSGTGIVDDGNPWRIEILELPSAKTPEIVERLCPVFTAKPDSELLQELEDRAGFIYPYQAQSFIPAKLAVSSVAKGTHDVSRRFAARPAFLAGEGLTAAEKGNAMHKFMQFADYENARDNLKGEISRMKNRAFLSGPEIESLSPGKLRSFFASPLAKRIFSSPKVWRELKFMAEFGKEELGNILDGMDDGSRVILNGVADCVFMETGGAVIVDYKTDRVKSLPELAERYRPQLDIYRIILSRNMGIPVSGCVLYSFALSEALWL